MGETSLELLKTILETIREQAEFGLKELQKSEEERSTRGGGAKIVSTRNILLGQFH